MKFSVSAAYKCLQRRYYDLNSSSKSISCFLVIFIFGVAFLVFLQFTEIWTWYEPSLSSFSNLAGSSFNHNLNQLGPIDVVYTWVNGSDPVFLGEMQAALGNVKNEAVYNDSTPARYRDKEELRYSLRSLEKYANWVRHVYIVTNGQIPYWLDLDAPRVTLVTHTDIFPDNTHLPTFSSPAIEAHLHRIPGLSEMFLYFNDDVFLGKPIFPDDFWTASRGYRVFLSWNIPDCSSECPWAWVGDGSCDPPCNIERCAYDNGDCKKKEASVNLKTVPPPKIAPILKDFPLSKEVAEVENVEKVYQDLKKGKLQKNDEREGKTKDLKNGGREKLGELFKRRETVIKENDLKNVIVRRKVLSASVIENDNTLDIKRMLSKVKSQPEKPLIVDLLKSQNVSDAVKISNLKYMEEKRKMKRNRRKSRRKTLDKESEILLKIDPSDVIGANKLSLAALNQSALSIRLADKPDWSEVNVSANGKAEKHLDMFGESLLFVHKLYNKVFGVRQRKVPAHMPHAFNKTIMRQLQERFPEEWHSTSQHQFRHTTDMQLAFSYFHFLLSSSRNRTVDDVFREFDTDQSGTWSDREIRTVLTRVYGTPLTLPAVLEFESVIKNCSKNVDPSVLGTPAPHDRYMDSKLPTVSHALVRSCPELAEMFHEEFPSENIYKTEIVYERQQDGVFKGLVNNLSQVLDTLDFIRANQRKFICINDNIVPRPDSEEPMILAVLHDFYHSLYPHPSQFELPANTRNRFTHVSEYVAWKAARRTTIIWICGIFGLALVATVYILLSSQAESKKRKYQTHIIKPSGSSESVHQI